MIQIGAPKLMIVRMLKMNTHTQINPLCINSRLTLSMGNTQQANSGPPPIAWSSFTVRGQSENNYYRTLVGIHSSQGRKRYVWA